MHSTKRILGLLIFLVCFASISYGATVTGTVKGSDGAALKGAFVQAQNTKTKITVSLCAGSLPTTCHFTRLRKQGESRIRDLICIFTFCLVDRHSQLRIKQYLLHRTILHPGNLSHYMKRQLLVPSPWLCSAHFRSLPRKIAAIKRPTPHRARVSTRSSKTSRWRSR